MSPKRPRLLPDAVVLFPMMRIAPWFVVALLLGLVIAKWDRETGFTSLVRFGETWEERRHPALRGIPIATVPGSSGYDGQFYAQIALDPTLQDPQSQTGSVDGAAYRARRIAMPAAAHVLGFTQPGWIVQAYALINVACWLLFAWLIRREIPGAGWTHFARWTGCVLSLGVLESVRQSLVDLPALLLLLLAIRAHRGENEQRTTLWLALGHLAKETNFLASAALLLAPKPNLRRCGLLALSILPFGLWILYVSSRFKGIEAGGSGFGNFTWPFVGILDQARLSFAALTDSTVDSRHLWFFIALAGFATQAFVLGRRRDLSSDWWRVGIVYAGLLIVLGPWVWSGYWAAARIALPLTIAFNVLLPANRAFWPLWILGNATALHGLWRFL